MSDFNFTKDGAGKWDHIAIFEQDSRICTKFDDRGNGFALFEKLSPEARAGLLVAIPEILKISAEDKEKGSADGIVEQDLADSFEEKIDLRVAKEEAELEKVVEPEK